jgi:hypothetical protein
MTAACRGLGGGLSGAGSRLLTSGALFGAAPVEPAPDAGRPVAAVGASRRPGRSASTGAEAATGGDATGAGVDPAGAGAAFPRDGAGAAGDGLGAGGAGVGATGAVRDTAGADGDATPPAGGLATSVGHNHHTSTRARRTAFAVSAAISQDARPHTDREVGARVSSRCTAGT